MIKRSFRRFIFHHRGTEDTEGFGVGAGVFIFLTGFQDFWGVGVAVEGRCLFSFDVYSFF
mgnify:CR=1 FL=1